MSAELFPFRHFNELASNRPRSLSATEAFHLSKEKHVQDFILARVFEALATNKIELPPCITMEINHMQVIKRGDAEQEYSNDMIFRVTLHPEEGGISSEVSTNHNDYEVQEKKHWILMRVYDDLIFECTTSVFPQFELIIDKFSAILSPTAFEYAWTIFHPDGATSSHRFYSTKNVQTGTPSEFAEHTSSIDTSGKSQNQHWTITTNANGTRDLSFFTQIGSAHLQKSSCTLHETISFDPKNNTQTYSYEHTHHGARIPKDAINIAYHSVTLNSYGLITHITVTWEKDGLTKPSHTTWVINYSPTAELERY